MHKPEFSLENETHKHPCDFEIHTDHLISARQPELVIVNQKKKKRTCQIVQFAVLANYGVKSKESEKKDKYLDLTREMKKLRNIRVSEIPVVNGALGTVTKGLVQRLEDSEIGGRQENIQTTALLRLARILRRVLETWGDLLSLKLQREING